MGLRVRMIYRRGQQKDNVGRFFLVYASPTFAVFILLEAKKEFVYLIFYPCLFFLNLDCCKKYFLMMNDVEALQEKLKFLSRKLPPIFLRKI